MDLWTKFDNSPRITNTKQFNFLNIENQRYDKIRSLILQNSYSYTFLRNDTFSVSEIKDDVVDATRTVKYIIDPEGDTDTYESQTVN